MNDLRIAAAGLGKRALRDHGFGCQSGRLATEDLRDRGQRNDGKSADGRQHAERWVQHIDDQQIEGDPRRIEYDGRPGSRKEATQVIKIPQRIEP
ncbi:hypothetical protein, partial [Mesorhizobium sp.]|uniref:hypothetical protein n=1 Tax=Mesorhizobium sp. TaxID=1871066 RepID=UPI0025BD3690